MKDFSIYIHIPFCVKKCAYCDFASDLANADHIDRYLDALAKEISLRCDQSSPEKIFGHNRPRTLFIGGGTPSVLNPQQFRRVVGALGERFDLSGLEEFTVEVNPGTVDETLLQVYKECGVDRISMGVQSFGDRFLRALGRIHTSAEAASTFGLVRRSGIPRVSIDLMMGLPGQTLSDLENDIEQALELEPDHISLYSLILEEGTSLYARHQKAPLDLPDEETERLMYWRAHAMLEDDGYRQYEISNFAKEGQESLHNIVYWHCGDYYGFGLSAHGRLPGYRYGNADVFSEYVSHLNDDRLPTDEIQQLTMDEFLEEWVMMGMRMNDGLNPMMLDETSRALFKEKFDDKLALAIADGYIVSENGCYRPTRKGIDYNNQLLVLLLYGR